jgi:hypothetical protein
MATGFGISTDEMAQAMVALGRAGISASQAAERLRVVMANLAMPSFERTAASITEAKTRLDKLKGLGLFEDEEEVPVKIKKELYRLIRED